MANMSCERYFYIVFSDVPLFVSVGNHDTFPVNMFPDISDSGKNNIKWLYSAFADSYKHWLPQPEIQKTLREGGYYTVRLRKKN